MIAIKKILIVTSEFPPSPGGIGNHAFNLAQQLSSKGFVIEVIADQIKESIHLESEFDLSVDIVIRRIKLKKIRFLMYFDRCRRVFKSIKSNDIIIATGKFSLWVVAFSSIFFNKKFIAIIHGTEVNYKKALLKKSIDISLKQFDKIIAVSNYTKSLVNDLKLKNIEVIPNGFNVSKSLSKVDMTLKGSPNLITVGGITRRKGQHNVIKALPHLLKTFPNLIYHVVGSPIEKDYLNYLVKKLNIEKHVLIYGIVSDEKKIALLKSSDIFIMLSEETPSGDTEGFGIALIEANALGVPTVGSKNCGIEDAIDNFKSGILVDSKDDIEIRDAIRNILESKPMFDQNAINWSRNFEWTKIADTYIKKLNI